MSAGMAEAAGELIFPSAEAAMKRTSLSVSLRALARAGTAEAAAGPIFANAKAAPPRTSLSLSLRRFAMRGTATETEEPICPSAEAALKRTALSSSLRASARAGAAEAAEKPICPSAETEQARTVSSLSVRAIARARRSRSGGRTHLPQRIGGGAARIAVWRLQLLNKEAHPFRGSLRRGLLPERGRKRGQAACKDEQKQQNSVTAHRRFSFCLFPAEPAKNRGRMARFSANQRAIPA